jgi:Type IV secretion system pilin
MKRFAISTILFFFLILPTLATAQGTDYCEPSVKATNGSSTFEWTPTAHDYSVTLSYDNCSSGNSVQLIADFQGMQNDDYRRKSNLMSVDSHPSPIIFNVGLPATIPIGQTDASGKPICTKVGIAENWKCTIIFETSTFPATPPSNKLVLEYTIAKSFQQNNAGTFPGFTFTIPTSTAQPPAGTATASASVVTGSNENVSGAFLKLPNPLGSAGINTTGDVIDRATTILMIIAVPFVTIMIMYAGFSYVAAYGNPEKIKAANKRLMWTLIGTVLLFGATTIGNAIINTVNKVTGDSDTAASSGADPANPATNQSGAGASGNLPDPDANTVNPTNDANVDLSGVLSGTLGTGTAPSNTSTPPGDTTTNNGTSPDQTDPAIVAANITKMNEIITNVDSISEFTNKDYANTAASILVGRYTKSKFSDASGSKPPYSYLNPGTSFTMNSTTGKGATITDRDKDGIVDVVNIGGNNALDFALLKTSDYPNGLVSRALSAGRGIMLYFMDEY